MIVGARKRTNRNQIGLIAICLQIQCRLKHANMTLNTAYHNIRLFLGERQDFSQLGVSTVGKVQLQTLKLIIGEHAMRIEREKTAAVCIDYQEKILPAVFESRSHNRLNLQGVSRKNLPAEPHFIDPQK